MINNLNLQLPPSYIEPSNPSTFLLDIFDSPFGLPCVCGAQTGSQDIHVVRPYIVRICQMSDNPCFVEIDFHLGTASGRYKFNRYISGFSVDTTNGVDGIWHMLSPDLGHSKHNPSPNNLEYKGTDMVDASWSFALFDPSNPLHINPDEPCGVNYQVLGIPVHKFVFDMCSHIDTWMSEPSIAFRLTFDKLVTQPHPETPCGVQFLME